MKTLSLAFLLLCAANAFSAEILPAISTNRWAGHYLGVLHSASKFCQERAEVDIFVHEDNEVTVIVYDYELNELLRATGTHAKGKIKIPFQDGYIFTATLARSRATGTLRPAIKGAGCSYSYSALRRWRHGYEIDTE
jgi:hypothetical protein